MLTWYNVNYAKLLLFYIFICLYTHICILAHFIYLYYVQSTYSSFEVGLVQGLFRTI